MDKSLIMWKIDDLNNQLKTASKEKRIEIEKELKHLGDKLTRFSNNRKKAKMLLQKSTKLTEQEIIWLLKVGTSKVKIAKSTGITVDRLNEILKGSGGEDVAKEHIEEAKRLLKETDLSVPQIAKKSGAKEATVYYHAAKLRPNPKEQQKEQQRKETSPSIDWKSKYDDIKNQYNDLQSKCESLEKTIEKQYDRIIELESSLQEIVTTKDGSVEWQQKYLNEKSAHEQLFQYLTLLQKGNNL